MTNKEYQKRLEVKSLIQKLTPEQIFQIDNGKSGGVLSAAMEKEKMIKNLFKDVPTAKVTFNFGSNFHAEEVYKIGKSFITKGNIKLSKRHDVTEVKKISQKEKELSKDCSDLWLSR